jgi:hypothetical protein
MNKKSHRYIILTTKYCRKDQRICDGRVRGAGDLIFQSLCGPVEIKKPLTWNAHCPSSSLKGSILFLESPSRGRPEFDGFYLFFRVEYEAAKLRWAGGRAAPRVAF